METLNGFADPKKPLITPHSALKIATITITDTLILTKMQKGENRLNDSPLDIMKMQIV